LKTSNPYLENLEGVFPARGDRLKRNKTEHW